eukprot:1161616-Pelagomonas_calceolata.AAC.3
MEFWWWKLGFTPRLIGHVLRDWMPFAVRRARRKAISLRLHAPCRVAVFAATRSSQDKELGS